MQLQFEFKRKCRKCGMEKPLSRFTRNKTVKTGRDFVCTRCRYLARRESALEWHRKKQAEDLEYKIRRRIYNQQPDRKAYVKKWHATHRDKGRERAKRARATPNYWVWFRKYQASSQGKFVKARLNALHRSWTKKGYVPMSEMEWKTTLQIFENKCSYCLTVQKLQMDHIVPVTKGGQHILGNVVPACRTCNASKSNRDCQTWMTEMGMNWPELQMKLATLVDVISGTAISCSRAF